ncbi:HD domain-containing protein [Desulfopila sp. IMCC35008]|uniref:HD domain-containing protein n=1 Tax=Desulfopila sp. IMCC35008 TaxID=2653858 RepID=UPI001F10524E|nr:HD domain-containing protein [Desulfopila sp. IMCC35008]
MKEAIQAIIGWLRAIGWNGSFLILAVVLIMTIIAVLALSRKKETVVQNTIHLRDLSKLWTEEDTKEIHISELSPLWRDEQSLSEDNKTTQLRNPRATAFMENNLNSVWFKKFPQQKAVCVRLLSLLDQQGQCPSVVDIRGDVEGGWDENTYQLLARISLLDHSLNVAEEVVQLLSENKAWHVIPDTMIAALAHDLGKLESIRGYLYSLGEHPLAAGRPLAGISEFENLPKKDEILQAIKLHHKMPKGLLGKTLKKADQQARQKELESTTLQKDFADTKEHAPPSATTVDQNTKNDAAWQAQADIYNEGHDTNSRKPKTTPQLVDISSWFEASQFLDNLKPYINKMFGRRFLAFSMSDGHVYFQAKVLEEVARKMAEKAGCMEIATMAHKDESMRGVLFTIVHQLRAEHDVVDRGLIKDTFFGGYFNVTRKIGKTIKGYYTPFHAESFGSVAEMEQAKPQMLRDIVKVSPYLDSDNSEHEN